MRTHIAEVMYLPNLVPRASFPLTSGRKTRALGATISGMRHRCRCAVSRITRIRLFPLFFHNGCSQSSRFPTAGQGERSSGNEIGICLEVVNSKVISNLNTLCTIYDVNINLPTNSVQKGAKKIYICYSPAGRSVLENTVLETEGTVFANTDRPRPVNNIFIYF